MVGLVDLVGSVGGSGGSGGSGWSSGSGRSCGSALVCVPWALGYVYAAAVCVWCAVLGCHCLAPEDAYQQRSGHCTYNVGVKLWLLDLFKKWGHAVCAVRVFVCSASPPTATLQTPSERSLSARCSSRRTLPNKRLYPLCRTAMAACPGPEANALPQQLTEQRDELTRLNGLLAEKTTACTRLAAERAELTIQSPS